MNWIKSNLLDAQVRWAFEMQDICTEISVNKTLYPCYEKTLECSVLILKVRLVNFKYALANSITKKQEIDVDKLLEPIR